MRRQSQQLGALIALIVFAMSAWSQNARYTVPAASVGEGFSSYHQALFNAADRALSNVVERAEFRTQTAVATNITAQPDEPTLHRFAQQYWKGDDEAVRRAVAKVTQLKLVLTPILNEEGIPNEVVAVVLVESAGQISALSPKGARGIWQFMPDTARRYGLTVNSTTDDRLDVQKSTLAAARYLRDLRSQFGSWSIVFAAYNAGEKLVQKAVMRAGSQDFALLQGKGLLPAETIIYVPAVLTASTLLDAASLTPLSPQNVLRDVIAPALEKVEIQWHGFHAFRRGLATNLRSLSVDDLTIKEILRHSDVSVTRASYIKRVDEKSVEAMERLETELRKPVQSVTAKGKTRKADTVVPVGMA